MYFNYKNKIDLKTINSYLAYRVGALLYTPATNETIAKKIIDKTYSNLRSICLCLEDSIKDDAIEIAEKTMCNTLDEIKNQSEIKRLSADEIPLLFIRIRNPEHMKKVYELIKNNREYVTGFVLPKYDLSNCVQYTRILKEINSACNSPIFIMPILESPDIAHIESRTDTLIKLKSHLDTISNYVINVRVGGNDFSNLFGVRRAVTQTIYDLSIVKDILVDIINVFGRDYIVSGPVWEYFDNGTSDTWKTGLENEVELDILNGFIGKTAIHPSQLEVINRHLRVSKNDYEDAIRILDWNSDLLGVEKSASGTRMNEVKVHNKWAERIIKRAECYGVKDDEKTN